MTSVTIFENDEFSIAVYNVKKVKGKKKKRELRSYTDRRNKHDVKLVRKLAKVTGLSETGIKDLAVNLCMELTGTWVVPTRTHAKEWVEKKW